ncbi:MAG TPA: Fe-S cluster assembly ATPase SufC [Sediminispirochaeta sp.]|nr:Fe-S cluster assembly ATPase SufC [Sediminispirochaeta sp.]
MSLLAIKDLSSSVYDSTTEEESPILDGLNLGIDAGEVHVLMGTNGSGKSTLANVLMGHPLHRVSGGSVTFAGEDLLALPADERARLGLFLAFQYPTAIPGLAVASFLKKAVEAYRGEEISVRAFQKELRAHMTELEIPKSFLSRFINDGFSGGEKKRMEVLQMKLLQPKLAILDETDSGLDIDALKLLFQNIAQSRESHQSLLIITHYERVLDYIEPDAVHIMRAGKIVRSGGLELSRMIHTEGFEAALR